MNFNEMKLGKSVEIFVMRDEYKLRLVSKIEDTAEDHISVTLIVGNGKRFLFKDTDEIQIVYKDHERLWRWKGLKGAITILDGTQVHSFYGTPEGESYNRRNAYRVYLGEEFTFSSTQSEYESLLSPEESDRKQEGLVHVRQNLSGILKDLSENGAGILTDQELNISDAVGFEIPTSVGTIRCIGRVVRASVEETVPYRNFYGIQFTQVSNLIAKYIFAVQRLNLKKTRG